MSAVDMERFARAMRAMPEGIAAAEAGSVSQDETIIQVKDGAQSDCTSYSTSQMKLFVSNGQSAGSVSTSAGDEEISDLFALAAENARYVSGSRDIEAGERIWAEEGESAEGADELREAALALEKEALSRGEVAEVENCSIRRRTIAHRMVNSCGADNSYKETRYILELGIKANTGGEKPVHAGASVTKKTFAELDCAEAVDRAVARAKLLGAGLPLLSPKSGQYDVVLTAQVAASIMLIAWMGIVGTHLGKGSAISPFDPATILTYEKTSPETWANGVHSALPRPCGDGMLKTPANREYGTELVTLPTRLYIAPGQGSPEELVGRMGTGMLINDACDIIHSVAPSNGDFAIVCDGVQYEGGKPVGRFERMVMFGTMQGFMRSLKAAANDLELHEFMQKSYAYGSPAVLLEKMGFTGA